MFSILIHFSIYVLIMDLIHLKFLYIGDFLVTLLLSTWLCASLLGFFVNNILCFLYLGLHHLVDEVVCRHQVLVHFSQLNKLEASKMKVFKCFWISLLTVIELQLLAKTRLVLRMQGLKFGIYLQDACILLEKKNCISIVTI